MCSTTYYKNTESKVGKPKVFNFVYFLALSYMFCVYFLMGRIEMKLFNQC